MNRLSRETCVIASLTLWLCACQDGGNTPVEVDLHAGIVDADASDSSNADASDSSNADASDAGSSVEYRICESSGALERIELYRIDHAGSTCTLLFFEERHPLCESKALLVSGLWCLSSARISADPSHCDLPPPSDGPIDAVKATAASGTFTIDIGVVTEIDVLLQFPGGVGLPQSVQVQAANCAMDCKVHDCPPAGSP